VVLPRSKNFGFIAKSDFSRETATRLPKDRILIVTEDAVTTPNYFKSLCKDLNLTSAFVSVCGEECGNDPSSVYQFAVASIKANLADSTSDDFDRVYCVFDRDGHATFETTVKAISQNPKISHETKSAEIIASISVPCFEYWVLLHLKCTDKPFQKCADVVKEIKRELPSYDKKKTKDVYSLVRGRIDQAVKNAKQVAQNAESDNPATQIYLLVQDLISQSKR
jgi:hypothetical protein